MKITTNTATVVVFDESQLVHRLNDDDDWWSDPVEELSELNQGNAMFVGLGFDGTFGVEVDVLARDAELRSCTNALLTCTSGTLLVGAGEAVPGGGVSPERREVIPVHVHPGTYDVGVSWAGSSAVRVELKATTLPGRNDFHTGLNLLSREASGPGSLRDPEVPAVECLRGLLGSPSELVRKFVVGLDVQLFVAEKEERFVISRHGFELVCVGGRLVYVHLRDACVASRTHQAFERYPLPLPFGLAFGDPKDRVIGQLGTPLKATPFFAICQHDGVGVRVGFSGGGLVGVNLLGLDSPIMNDLDR